MCHNLGISSINNLEINFTNNPFITWSPPSFYSIDIPYGSITTYHVIVKSKNGSIIVDGNTTDTFYQLPSDLTVNCNSYNVSVTAFIEQYSSSATDATKENIGSKIILIIYYYYITTLSDYTIDILNHDVKFNNSGNSSIIQVQFTINVRTTLHKHITITLIDIYFLDQRFPSLM